MPLKPLQDRVVVKITEQDEFKKIGNILVPEIAKERPQEGVVLSVGSGRYDNNGNRIPSDLNRGDTVLFGKYSGTEVEVDGEKVLILREEEIMGVFAD